MVLIQLYTGVSLGFLRGIQLPLGTPNSQVTHMQLIGIYTFLFRACMEGSTCGRTI